MRKPRLSKAQLRDRVELKLMRWSNDLQSTCKELFVCDLASEVDSVVQHYDNWLIWKTMNCDELTHLRTTVWRMCNYEPLSLISANIRQAWRAAEGTLYP